MCWYCYWGWPAPVADIYLKALDMLDGDMTPLHFRDAHVVWEDCNFHAAERCLEDMGDDLTPEDDIVKWSLQELCKIPMDVRCCAPDEYDNPEDHPPPDGMALVRV